MARALFGMALVCCFLLSGDGVFNKEMMFDIFLLIVRSLSEALPPGDSSSSKVNTSSAIVCLKHKYMSYFTFVISGECHLTLCMK